MIPLALDHRLVDEGAAFPVFDFHNPQIGIEPHLLLQIPAHGRFVGAVNRSPKLPNRSVAS
jgi:hypothetical protein